MDDNLDGSGSEVLDEDHTDYVRERSGHVAVLGEYAHQVDDGIRAPRRRAELTLVEKISLRDADAPAQAHRHSREQLHLASDETNRQMALGDEFPHNRPADEPVAPVTSTRIEA